MATYKITFSKANWSGGTDAIWYDTISQAFFGDADCTQEVTSIEPPTRECYRFNGYYSAASGGVQYIDDAGNFTDALQSLSITAAKTFTAQGTQTSWKLTLDDNGGDGGGGALYYRIDGGGYFDNYLCEGEPVSTVTKPSLADNAFAGYYNGTSTPGAQYIDAAGNFTASLDALALTAAKTIYAKWVAPYKITISANSGTGGTTAFYFDSVSGKFYTGTDLAEEIAAITPHTRECFSFLGCYSSNNTTSTVRVSADGTITTDWTPTGAATIYAQWSRVSWKVTLNKSSGTGGTSALYYKIDGGGYYADDLCTEQAHEITPPTRSGYVFKGYYSASSNGTQYIDRSGSFLPDFNALTLTAAKTIYAQWKAAYKITLNKSSGTGGTDAIWYSSEDAAFFADAACTTPATSVTIPTRECYRFTGYYNTASGTTQYIDDGGDYTASLSSLSITSAKTFYAQWTRVSYKATLDDNGGTGGGGAFYFDGKTANFYADDQLTTPTTTVDVPTREGYNFIGYYASKSGGSRYVSEGGTIVVSVALTKDLAIYARWRAREYTLTFDYNGGTGGTVSKTVTFGAAIGELPTPTRDKASFVGWYIGGLIINGLVSGGTQITDSTVWNIAEDKIATASWLRCFGGVADYFGLASDALIPIASTTGDTRHRVAVSHGGKYESDVNEIGGIWRNPSVTYVVKANTTVAVQLGKAWAATFTGSGSKRKMTVSGYMTTTVEIVTEIGKFPTVTVSAVANEGANAVNNFTENKDKFNVSVPVVARSKAQNLLNAISGGGYLQSCRLVAACDPVVCEENLMPCASDIVNGRYELSAETLAPNGEAAPTMTAASGTNGGFALIDDPRQGRDCDFIRYTIEARKEMV